MNKPEAPLGVRHPKGVIPLIFESIKTEFNGVVGEYLEVCEWSRKMESINLIRRSNLRRIQRLTE